jgi:hypothetical protein
VNSTLRHTRNNIYVYVTNNILFDFSSMPVAIEGEHLPTEVGYNTGLQSGHAPGEDHQQMRPFLTICANPLFHKLSGWLVSDDPAAEEAGCGGPSMVTHGLRL